MKNSIKTHLLSGKMKINGNGKVIYKKTSGRPISHCKSATAYVNDFVTFHKYVEEGYNVCKCCLVKYWEHRKELTRLRNK